VERTPDLGDPVGDHPVFGHQPASLYGRSGCPLPYHAAVCSLSEQQPERAHDHGLACTRLTRDGREAGPERQGRVLDHAQVRNAEFVDHRGGAASSVGSGIPRVSTAGSSTPGTSGPTGPRHPVTGRWNLLTRRSVNGPWCSRASRTGTGERRTTT